MSNVYFCLLGTGDLVKIGYSANMPKRLRQLRKEYNEDACFIWHCPGGKKEESAFHKRFSHLKTDRLEVFHHTDDLKQFLIENRYEFFHMPLPVQYCRDMFIKGTKAYTEVAEMLDRASGF